MDKRQELLKKLQILVQEVDKAKNSVDDEKIKYLNNYKSWVENVIAKLQDGMFYRRARNSTHIPLKGGE